MFMVLEKDCKMCHYEHLPKHFFMATKKYGLLVTKFGQLRQETISIGSQL